MVTNVVSHCWRAPRVQVFFMPGCMRMSSVGVILRTIFSAYVMGPPIFVTLSTRASGRELREICVSRSHCIKGRAAFPCKIGGAVKISPQTRSHFSVLQSEHVHHEERDTLGSTKVIPPPLTLFYVAVEFDVTYLCVMSLRPREVHSESHEAGCTARRPSALGPPRKCLAR